MTVSAEQPPMSSGTTRSVLLVASGLVIIALMAFLTPRIGPIGVGTLLALFVAVYATRSALQGHRHRRLE